MRKVLPFSILFVLALGLNAQETAIRNVNIIDVRTGKLMTGQGVIVSGDKISWIGPDKRLRLVSGTRVVDGTGKYIMPGLIDSHIHFFQSGSLYTRPDAVTLTRVSYKEERERGLKHATDYLTRYLRLGITTVMDVGGPFSNFAIRDSISKNMISPNILVTGPLFSIVEARELELNDAPIVKVTSNAEAESLFTKMLPYLILLRSGIYRGRIIQRKTPCLL